MFEKIKDKIKDKQLIIFGELHGTKEIPNAISKFFLEIAKQEDFNVCLEIPEEFQKEINEFMDKKERLENVPFFLDAFNSDGRNSVEYINLIKDLHKLNEKHKRNIKIFCIDSNKNTQKENEDGIAKNIMKNLENKKTFAILGEIHASKNPVLINGLNIITAGAILFDKLKNKILTIRIMPAKGKFFSFGIKEITSDNLDAHFNKNFDYVFEIGEVSPCSFSILN